MELNNINWNLVPMNTLVWVSDDEENYYKGYFYRQVEDGFQTFPEPMNYDRNLSDMAVTWYYIKPYEEITVEEIDKGYNSHCKQYTLRECWDKKCKYYELDEDGDLKCKLNWLLDHYNLTEKE